MRPHLNLLTSLMLWSVSIFSQPNEVLKEAQLFFGKYPFKVHSIDRIALNEQIKERDSLKLMEILSLFSIRNRLGRQGTDRNSSENNREWKHWDLLFTS